MLRVDPERFEEFREHLAGVHSAAALRLPENGVENASLEFRLTGASPVFGENRLSNPGHSAEHCDTHVVVSSRSLKDLIKMFEFDRPVDQESRGLPRHGT
jgi:hypothetical protein